VAVVVVVVVINHQIHHKQVDQVGLVQVHQEQVVLVGLVGQQLLQRYKQEFQVQQEQELVQAVVAVVEPQLETLPLFLQAPAL
jgi:ABC-type oligopeptide transport system ATPase subunit